jgi:hypothetical protein
VDITTYYPSQRPANDLHRVDCCHEKQQGQGPGDGGLMSVDARSQMSGFSFRRQRWKWSPYLVDYKCRAGEFEMAKREPVDHRAVNQDEDKCLPPTMSSPKEAERSSRR